MRQHFAMETLVQYFDFIDNRTIHCEGLRINTIFVRGITTGFAGFKT